MFPGQAPSGILDAVALARAFDGEDLLRRALPAGIDPVDLTTGRATHLLDRTEVLQPVLVAIALAIVAALAARGARPDLVLGHSLGELSAWAAIGELAPRDAVDVARVRGEAMARAARARPGGMLAIGTSDPSVVDGALAEGRRRGELDVAAYNAPDETVLAGDLAALRAAERVAPRPQRLRVEGPWHSPQMAVATDAFADALARAPRATAARPVRFITNRDGSIAPAEDIPSLLVGQLTRPVAWTACLTRAIAEGASELVVVEPSSTARAHIVKHLDRTARRPSLRVRTCEELLA